MEVKKYYWLSIYTVDGQRWESQPQIPIYGTWADAVKTAEAQDNATRLSETAGYNNQGHYFQPDNFFVG